jgi:hypothetical protein
LLGSGSDQGQSRLGVQQQHNMDSVAVDQAVFFDESGAAYDPLDASISHMTSPSPVSALLNDASADLAAAVSAFDMPFCGPPIRTKIPEVSHARMLNEDAEDPSSARSTCSAYELGPLYGQCNPVDCGPFDGAFSSGQPTHSSISQQFLFPVTAAYSSTTGNYFGLYGSSTAQLQGPAYMQDPAQAMIMQLQADLSVAAAGLGLYQTAPMAAPWGGPQGWQQGSMAMPAPAQQPVWEPTSSQQRQHSVHSQLAASKKRPASDDDDDYNPSSGVSWQSVLTSSRCLCIHSHACNAPAQPAAAKQSLAAYAGHAQAMAADQHPACSVCMLMCLQIHISRHRQGARRRARRNQQPSPKLCHSPGLQPSSQQPGRKL